MLTDFLKVDIIREDMAQIYMQYPHWDKFHNKSVYINGATGMIASYIVFFFVYLNEEKDILVDIYASARKTEKARERFGHYLDRSYIHFIEADASDEIALECRFDYILHAASLARPQFYGRIPVDVILPNMIGTWRLLEHAKRFGCEGMVFFSSGSIYGDLGDAAVVSEDMYGKLAFLAPGNCYGESKRAGELLCVSYQKQFDVRTVVIRAFHVYSPIMDIENDVRVFAEFMHCLINGEDIVMRSDGSASRAFCYATDAVSGILIALLEGESGGCYNIGNPNEYMTIKRLAELFTSLSKNKTLRVITEERPVSADYSPSPEGKKTVMDISRMEHLGWQPKVSAAEGFMRCYRYLKDQEEEQK